MIQKNSKLLQGAILLGTSVFLFIKISNTTLYYYIHQRFTWLTVFAAALLLILSVVVFVNYMIYGEDEHVHHHHDHDHNHDHGHEHDHEHQPNTWALLLLALPVGLGLLLPASPLQDSVIQSKGFSNNTSLVSSSSSEIDTELPFEEYTILDWIRAFNYAEDPSIYTGQPADVIGFIFHDDSLPPNQFLVGRIGVTCCVADAVAIGVVVSWPDAEELPDNAWVQVTGDVQSTTLNNKTMPLIEATGVTRTEAPDQPYVFP